MIIYFADRAMNILGSASTGLPKGLMITNDKKTEEIYEGAAIFECNLDYDFVNSDEAGSGCEEACCSRKFHLKAEYGQQ